jgi:hypothetical protein
MSLKEQLRNLALAQTENKGNRSLLASMLVPELVTVLKAWSALKNEGVLIGGAALSFYVKPRVTQDLDFLFLSEAQLPQPPDGFKKIRAHAFEHVATGVEVEILTPEFLKASKSLIQHVMDTAITNSGVKIASPSALIALKLNRLSFQDKADIEALLDSNNIIDVSLFHLTAVQKTKLAALKKAIKLNKQESLTERDKKDAT